MALKGYSGRGKSHLDKQPQIQQPSETRLTIEPKADPVTRKNLDDRAENLRIRGLSESVVNERVLEGVTYPVCNAIDSSHDDHIRTHEYRDEIADAAKGLLAAGFPVEEAKERLEGIVRSSLGEDDPGTAINVLSESVVNERVLEGVTYPVCDAIYGQSDEGHEKTNAHVDAIAKAAKGLLAAGFTVEETKEKLTGILTNK